jgi:sulfopropanediol 3-dehydrogenase
MSSLNPKADISFPFNETTFIANDFFMITILKPGRNLDERQQAERDVRTKVEEIIERVRQHGDTAIRELSVAFDKWDRESYRLSKSEIDQLLDSLPQAVIRDIEFAQQQIRTFAQAQRKALTDIEIETIPGVRLGHKNIPVNSVGAYVPGGRYPMVASAHMSVVTAKVAGVKRVIAATPPLKGVPPAATVAAIVLGGADEVFVLGGVQAIAAFALGTETIDPVDMLVGPGNAYVAEAKRQLFGTVGIDLLAGSYRDLDHCRRYRRCRNGCYRSAGSGRAWSNLTGDPADDLQITR